MEEIRSGGQMIPYIDCATTAMVAKRFGVPETNIYNKCKTYKKELENMGAMVVSISEFEDLLPSDAEYVRKGNRGNTDFRFPDGTVVKISNAGSHIFPRKAVEYIGSLMNTQKKREPKRVAEQQPVTEQQPVAEQQSAENRTAKKQRSQTRSARAPKFRNTEEKKLCLSLAKAFATGDTMKVLNAALDLDTFRIGMIEELTDANRRILKSADRRIPWTSRASATRIIKVISEVLEQPQKDVMQKLICKLVMEYKLPLESRGVLPLIDAVEGSEWHLVYQAISELCRDKCLDIKRIFEKAEINTAGLSLTIKEE